MISEILLCEERNVFVPMAAICFIISISTKFGQAVESDTKHIISMA